MMKIGFVLCGMITLLGLVGSVSSMACDSGLNRIDPNGPRPMHYEDALLWDAMQSGLPPSHDGGGHYIVPTVYEDRVRREEEFRKIREGLGGGYGYPKH